MVEGGIREAKTGWGQMGFWHKTCKSSLDYAWHPGHRIEANILVQKVEYNSEEFEPRKTMYTLFQKNNPRRNAGSHQWVEILLQWMASGRQNY